jgi:hypothetical protein
MPWYIAGMRSCVSLNVLVLLALVGCSSKSEAPETPAAGCVLPGATSERNASGDCVIVDCDSDFADCDGEDANGCEVSLLDTTEHCGECDNSCTAGNVELACVDGACSGMFRCSSGYFNLNGNETDGCESSTPCPDEIVAGDSCHTLYKQCVMGADCYQCDGHPEMPEDAVWAATQCINILPEQQCPNFVPEDVACTSVDQFCSYRNPGTDCWLTYRCDAEQEKYRQVGCDADTEECAAGVAVDEACPTDGATCVTAQGQCMVCQGTWITEC